jgi:hypothetical protein
MRCHRNMKTFALLFAALTFFTNVMAEIPPLNIETLKTSPHIITGTVTSIAKQDVVLDQCFVRIDVTVTVKLDQPTAPGAKTIPAKYERVRGHINDYRCTDRPRPPGPSGIWELSNLREGNKVTIHAVGSRQDGTLVIRQPNGLTIIK